MDSRLFFNNGLVAIPKHAKILELQKLVGEKKGRPPEPSPAELEEDWKDAQEFATEILAYLLWRADDCRPCRDQQNWLDAEKLIGISLLAHKIFLETDGKSDPDGSANERHWMQADSCFWEAERKLSAA